MYSKQTWENDKGLDLQASHLNHMEDGIAAAHTIAESKQDELISGETIKTINGNNILGSGNIQIGGGGGGGADIIDDLESTRTDACLSANMGRHLNEKKQEKLIAGDNIEIDEETNTISATSGGGEPAQYLKTIAKNESSKEITITDKQGNATTFAYGGGGGGGITLLDVYPVGSIYMSVNNVSPATLFGGTWEEWAEGQVPVGVKSGDSDFGSVEATGGSKNATLVSHTHSMSSHTHSIGSHSHSYSGTTDSDGSHSHTITARSSSNTATGGDSMRLNNSTQTTTSAVTCGSAGSHSHSFSGTTGSASGTTGSGGSGTTGSAGSDGTGKNLQPYITCYMWKRTA